MLLKKLKLKNIRSYKEFEIEFPKGSILLAGDIGTGKTSILLALQFALFGLQPGQKGASILRQGCDEAYVSLELDIDNKSVVLERTLKRSKNSISQESNSIIINGEKEELSTSEMKNKVIEILEYPKEFAKKSNLLYKFTVYTPQEEMKDIIQERPEIRLDTLRHIFGIDRYKRIEENAQIFLQKIKEVIKIKEGEIKEINILKEKQTQKTENLVQLNREINNLNIEYKTIEKEKKDAEEKLNSAQRLIEQKQKLDFELSNKETELRGKNELKSRLDRNIFTLKNQISEKIEFEEEKLLNIANLLLKKKQMLEELNSRFLNINSKISVLESKKENALKLNDKVSSLENCPTCYQSVSPEHKDKMSKRTKFELEDIERELEPKIIEKTAILRDIEQIKELIRGYEKDKNEMESNRIRFQHQKDIEIKIKSDSIVLDRVLAEIFQLEKQISEIKIKIASFLDSEKLFLKEKNNFEAANLKAKSFEINLAQKSKESEILKLNLEELKEEITRKEKIRSQINYLRELQDWTEEKFIPLMITIESNVMIKLRNEFSKIFNEWFSILVSDSLSVRLDEDFTPIIAQQDYEIDYEFLSGGERTAVALAYRLALNQVLNSMLSKIKTKNILILDEPTDGFSEQQLFKMRDILEQLKSEQIILVSHEQKIESFVDNVIRIKKEGTSSIV
ncbi:MAG: AAA family ATPase [Nanoarchaeota archaeon]|nr:AAA family ATPase [Nanoarchaeota archaeon]